MQLAMRCWTVLGWTLAATAGWAQGSMIQQHYTATHFDYDIPRNQRSTVSAVEAYWESAGQESLQPMTTLPGDEGWEGFDDIAPLWYIDAGAHWLTRGDVNTVRYSQVIDFNNNNAIVNQYTSKDQQYRVEPGWQARLGRRLRNGASLEASYMSNQSSLGGFLATNTQSQPIVSNFFNFGIIPAQGSTAANHEYGYFSHLQNIEGNLLWPLLENSLRKWTLKMGGRAIFLKEDLHLRQRFDFIDPNFPGLSGELAGTEVENRLYGAQIGLQWEEFYGPFVVSFHGNYGGFLNQAQQTTQNVQALFGVPTPQLFNTVKDEQLSSLYEFGTSLKLIATDNFGFVLGYQVMVLTNMSVAPENLAANLSNTDPPNSVLTLANPPVLVDRTLIYHGPTAAIHLRW